MNKDNTADTVQSLWQRIEAWLGRNAPSAWQMLRPGASEQEIQQAEAAMDLTLPDVFAGTGYRIYTLWENIAGIAWTRFSGSFPSFIQLKAPAVVGELSLEEGRLSRRAVTEKRRWWMGNWQLKTEAQYTQYIRTLPSSCGEKRGTMAASTSICSSICLILWQGVKDLLLRPAARS